MTDGLEEIWQNMNRLGLLILTKEEMMQQYRMR